MGALKADRLWIFGGAVAIVLLIVAGYFLLVSPKYDEATEVRIQVQDTETQLVRLQHRIADLQQQETRVAEYAAALKANQEALPADAGVSDFLRQLEAAGTAVSVSVDNISVATPTRAAGIPNVWELPIALTASGGMDNLGSFLTQLQSVQPRAVLVKSAALAQGADSSTTPSLNLSITAYVSPPVGAGAPLVTTNK